MLANVMTGSLMLVVRSWTDPRTMAGSSALYSKLIDSTLVCGPMATESARCGTPNRCGGPQ